MVYESQNICGIISMQKHDNEYESKFYMKMKRLKCF